MSLPLQAAYVGFGGMFGALTRYWLEEIFIDI
jgi:fluoride ion exporter CrcB/FEX